MAGLVILILLVSTFSTKDSLASEAKGVVCECCEEKYGLECGVSDNGVYGDWEYCVSESNNEAPKKLVKMDRADEQCEGEECPAGCCPEKCWFCCYGYFCAPTPADCQDVGGLPLI